MIPYIAVFVAVAVGLAVMFFSGMGSSKARVRFEEPPMFGGCDGDTCNRCNGSI